MRVLRTAMPLFVSAIVVSLSGVTCDHIPDTETFAQCLQNHSNPSYPISAVVYTPSNSSYLPVLQSYIRNLRFNESYTPKPLLIVTALHESHIQASIICSKNHGIQMRIRSGGHDYEGASYVSHVPFFVLDMFRLRSINVSMDDETAWVEAGATLGEVYYRIAEKSNVHGFPAGVGPTIGVGGHFSGGGYGNLLRKYGLSVDNIVDAKIVDVNGNLLDRKSMGGDLFWEITGGGGSSFAVILAYKIKLVRVPPKVTVFRVERRYEQNATLIAHRWQRVADKLDRDIFIRMTIEVANSTNREGEKTIRATFLSLFLGNSDRLLTLVKQGFPELGLKKSDCIEMSWVESVLYWTEFPIGTPTDALLSRVPQVKTYLSIKSDYVKNPMPTGGLEYIFKKMIEMDTPTLLTFNPYGGRMAEISPYATPFPHRAGNIAKIQYETNWYEGGVEKADYYINLARELHAYMTPFVSKSPREAFVNYRDNDLGINHNGKDSYFEGKVYGIKYFLGNFNRLVEIKTRVDPENFLRYEQSIPTFPSRQKIIKCKSCNSLHFSQLI